MERKYDIILFGATGFTGQLVAAEIMKHLQEEKVRLCLAGRDMKKLEAIRQQIGATPEEVGLLTAAVDDPVALEAMAQQGRVIISTVGPYNWYGAPLIEACLKAGTHYVDITGEPAFIHDTFNKAHERALEIGICMVNCCGFDSIPADLGTWLTVRALPSKLPTKVEAFVRTNATFSGGTWTTAIHALSQRSEGKKAVKSYPRHPKTPRVPLKIHYNKTLKRWAIPMPVADPHIVKRSARHIPEDYGEAFGYGQFFTVGSLFKVFQVVLPIAMVMLLVRFKGVKKWLFAKHPPGTGPSEQQRANSKFEVICLGEAGDQRVETIISGGDPGYTETAKMLSQSAFVLLEKVRSGGLNPGVRTPAEALGMNLVDRLKRQGIRIETRLIP
jgi:saccharopine dehydrogenase (NAD+, L-glutamate forming)